MANWRDEVLLEAEFTVFDKKRTLCKVTLIPGALFYSPISSLKNQYNEKIVKISDVIGCQSSSLVDLGSTISATHSNNNTASFTVFAYPFRKKLFSGKKTRHRHAIIFEVNRCSSLEENRSIALIWKNVIDSLARGHYVKPCDVERCVPPPWGTFLVLINPHSGPGRALQIFKNEVEPMFEEANIPFKLVVTEYAGHAIDYIQNLDLSEWAAIVIVSGDGLVHEVINGLMQRPDWTSAIKKAIGCVPGGSGNALACSINNAAGEPVLVNPALHSTFVLIKHRVVPMDLVLVQTPSKQCYSFLSVTWGIIADADLESEKYRYLGEARFTIGALKRVLGLRAYEGKLSFLPVAEYNPKTAMTSKALKRVRRLSLQSLSSTHSVERIESKAMRSSTIHFGSRSTGNHSIPTNRSDWSEFASESGDASFLVEHKSKLKIDSAAYSAENHMFVAKDMSNIDLETSHNASENTPTAAVVEITASTDIRCNPTLGARQISCPFTAVMNGTVPGSNTGSADGQHNGVSSLYSDKCEDCEEEVVYADKEDGQAVPTPLLPPLDQPVPDDWVVINGKFVLFCALYQSHMGSDLLTAPSARLSDGVIHLMFVRDGISRSQLLNVLMSFSEGTHIDMPEVEFVPVLAFRLEPTDNRGHFMIDGEMLDPSPLQAQVLPGLGRIMAIQ